MSLVTINNEYLSSIGDAIREKSGTTDLIKPKDMSAAILAITTGGGGDFELPPTTGDCSYRFAYNGWNSLFDYVTTQDITSCNNMFYNSTEIETIPFEINCHGIICSIFSYMFYGCEKLKSIPKINGNNLDPAFTSHMFNSCENLRYLPEDIESWFTWSKMDASTSQYSASRGHSIFYDCYSLRSVPMGFLNHECQTITSGYSCMYQNLFQYCYALDEIVGLPVHYRDKGITGNFFMNTFKDCYRLENMTFALQEDGTPYKAKWKNQVIDLSDKIGWGYESSITGYNSGITTDGLVSGTNVWVNKIGTPNWYATDYKFSRYNLDSAIATINSLPDTSEYLAEVGGTNTIKFYGEAGNGEAIEDESGTRVFKTIRNLTEEQIAVATAKGWTVSLV